MGARYIVLVLYYSNMLHVPRISEKGGYTCKGSEKTKTCYFENSLQSRDAYDWREIRSRNSDSIDER